MEKKLNIHSVSSVKFHLYHSVWHEMDSDDKNDLVSVRADRDYYLRPQIS